MTKFEQITYADLHAYYNVVIRQMMLESYKPDVIFAPMRGGADFGVKLSSYYAVPFEPIVWQTRDGTEQDHAGLKALCEKYQSKRILIVDDICDSGATIRSISQLTQHNDVKFAVSIENIQSGVNVHYAGREISRDVDTQWFVFPWEKWWKNTETA